MRLRAPDAIVGDLAARHLGATLTTSKPGRLSLDELREEVRDGVLDTVLVAVADLQGRLQGKRFDAQHFLDEVAHDGTEGCSYVLASDVDMATVDGFALSSWQHGLRRPRLPPGPRDAAPRALA